jgi:flagellar biosynthetic protein FliR
MQGVPLPELEDAQLAGFVLCLSRVGALFLMAPVLSSRLIPVRAKLMAAFGICLALTPIATRGKVVPTEPIALAQLMVKELVVGLSFAFVIAALGAAVQAGAALVDTVIGFSFGAILDPVTNQQNAVLGQFFAILAAVVFVATGGVELMIMGLAKTYEIVPLDAFPGAETLMTLAGSAFTQLLVVALEVAAPPLIALLVADAALGIVSRAVPQMNVFVVGLPAKILLGLAAIGASIPFLTGHLSEELERAVATALRGLAGG